MRNQAFSKSMMIQLKRKSTKVARLEASKSLSDNEIAAGFKKNGDSFLSSYEWKALRKKVIEHYGAKCMRCMYVPTNRKHVNVDHIKPRKYYPDLALSFSNMQVLCCACNKLKGNKHETDYRPS